MLHVRIFIQFIHNIQIYCKQDWRVCYVLNTDLKRQSFISCVIIQEGQKITQIFAILETWQLLFRSHMKKLWSAYLWYHHSEGCKFWTATFEHKTVTELYRESDKYLAISLAFFISSRHIQSFSNKSISDASSSITIWLELELLMKTEVNISSTILTSVSGGVPTWD